MAIGFTSAQGGRVYSVANGTIISIDAKTGNIVHIVHLLFNLRDMG